MQLEQLPMEENLPLALVQTERPGRRWMTAPEQCQEETGPCQKPTATTLVTIPQAQASAECVDRGDRHTEQRRCE